MCLDSPCEFGRVSPYFPAVPESLQARWLHALVPSVTEWFYLDQATRLLMAPTYKTFQNLGPFKSIRVVDPSVIYLKDGSGATLVELDVELKAD